MFGGLPLGFVLGCPSLVPKSEISLKNVAFDTQGREGQSPKIGDFPRKCSTLRRREERPRNRDFPWDMWHFERLWGGLYDPMACQLDNCIFGKFLAVRSRLNNPFELIFERCHLTFSLNLFWN